MARPRLSILLPYYNEQGYLAATLASLLSQRRPPDQLVAVDNGSDDGSQSICRDLLASVPFEVTHVSEPDPGRLPALAAGLAEVRGDWVVHCDADTYYPPHYLERVEHCIMHASARINSVMALNLPGPRESEASIRSIAVRQRLHVRHPTRCFTGACGHTLRTSDLRAVGGYSTQRWPFVLGDHEIMHRMMKLGRSVYDEQLWCIAADRRQDQTSMRWTWFERMLYRNVLDRHGDWFFYSFLAKRFARRGMFYTKLRERDWDCATT